MTKSDEAAKPTEAIGTDVPLTKPITAHDEEIEVLHLDPPSVKQIRKIGLPYTLNTSTQEMSIDTERCHRYIVALGKIPPSAVDDMTPADFQVCCMEVVAFFGGPASETSGD